MKALANIALGLVVLGASASAAHAALITNGSNTTLFYDDFEGVTPPATPVAVTGAWSKSGSPLVQTGTTPNAYQGDNYLQISRATNDLAYADFGKQTSGTIHAEFMLYVRSTDYAQYGAQIGMRNDAVDAWAIILSPIADGTVSITTDRVTRIPMSPLHSIHGRNGPWMSTLRRTPTTFHWRACRGCPHPIPCMTAPPICGTWRSQPVVEPVRNTLLMRSQSRQP